MTVSSTVLFGQPQHEIASLIRNQISRSSSVQIVAGFLTVEGANLLTAALDSQFSKIGLMLVGAGTYRAFEAMDQLIAMGTPQASLMVHLGHGYRTTSSARHRFYRYHPMLHSKVYYFERADGTAAAIIGSHNVTGFALGGLNGEASVLLEGPKESEQFVAIREHIAQACQQSVNYNPAQKEALAWWTKESFEGIRDKTNDIPRDSDNKKTIVILAEGDRGNLPKRGETLYFELPKRTGQIYSLRTEVHLFIFERLPSTPAEGLLRLDEAIESVWCLVMGLEMEQGGRELLADWQVGNNRNPVLRMTESPFRPNPGPEMQQVRAQIYSSVRGDFEYLFGPAVDKWLPVFSDEISELKESSADRILYGEQVLKDIKHVEFRPNNELVEWQLVRDLKAEEDVDDPDSLKQVLIEYSPAKGSYIMLSPRRKQKQTEN